MADLSLLNSLLDQDGNGLVDHQDKSQIFNFRTTVLCDSPSFRRGWGCY